MLISATIVIFTPFLCLLSQHYKEYSCVVYSPLLCCQGENPFTDNQDEQDPEDCLMEVSEGDADGKQEGKQEEAELAEITGEPETVGNGDGHEVEMKMEGGEGGEEEGKGGEEIGVKVKQEEEEVGVEVKEDEPEGAEEVDDVENFMQGADDDDGGIPVIEDEP